MFKVWNWLKDKLVGAVAYAFIYALVFGYAVWLGICWCGRVIRAGAKGVYRWGGWKRIVDYVRDKLVPAAKKLLSGVESATLVITTGVALVVMVWGVVHVLSTFRFMYVLQLPVISGWDWFYAIVGRALIIAGVSFIFWTALVVVETNHFRFVTFCGKRTRRVVGEGWHLVAPFYLGGLTKDVQKTIGGVQVDVTAEVQSDEDEMLMVGVIFKDGRVVYSQDASTRDTLNNYILVEDKDTILKEIANTAKQVINFVGGNTRFTDCRKNLEALVRYINCALRLEECPHMNPKHHLGRVLPKGDPRIAKLKEDEVPVGKRLQFYVKWGQWIDKILKTSTSRSELENRLGVVIKEFKVGDLDYSPEVKAAMEKRTTAAAQVAADQKTQEFIKSTAEAIASGKVPIGAYQLAGVLGGKLKAENYKVFTKFFPEAPEVAEKIAEGVARALGGQKP
jgi:regulator of protease activity HflC (stomatin/prohibitin superfamily)